MVEGFGGTQRREYRQYRLYKRRICKDLKKDLEKSSTSCFFVFIFWFHIKLGAAPGAALALVATTLLQLQKKAFGHASDASGSLQVAKEVSLQNAISHKRVIYYSYILYIMAIYSFYLGHIIDIHAFASQKRMQELWNKDNVHLTVNNCTERIVCTSRMFVVR